MSCVVASWRSCLYASPMGTGSGFGPFQCLFELMFKARWISALGETDDNVFYIDWTRKGAVGVLRLKEWNSLLDLTRVKRRPEILCCIARRGALCVANDSKAHRDLLAALIRSGFAKTGDWTDQGRVLCADFLAMMDDLGESVDVETLFLAAERWAPTDASVLCGRSVIPSYNTFQQRKTLACGPDLMR